MTDLNEAIIIKALEQIVSPEMIKGLQIKDGHVLFSIEVDPQQAPSMEPLRKSAEDSVKALPGVTQVTAILTAERQQQAPSQSPPASASAPSPFQKTAVPGVKHIIAVASGKGGVGKSTVAVNLAVALSQQGFKTGLLDADIYGPSIPAMLGIQNQKPNVVDQKLIPLEAHGLKAMSIGVLIDEGTPVIWRGPMIQKALQQMLYGVDWGMLDILIIDMPPGTGDVQLTMAQKTPLAGAVIVSTPQDIALLDACKGLEMFRKVNVPILGMIENMSTFICPNCDHESHIFGHGGARKEAENRGCDFLGEIPLNTAIRIQSDEGTPVTLSDERSRQSFAEIACRIMDNIKQEKEAA